MGKGIKTLQAPLRLKGRTGGHIICFLEPSSFLAVAAGCPHDKRCSVALMRPGPACKVYNPLTVNVNSLNFSMRRLHKLNSVEAI